MSFCVSQPSPALSPYIKQYWALNHSVQPGNSYTQRIIPSGLPELTFYLSARPKPHTKNRVFEDNILVSGQHNDFYDILISDSISIFSILFKPEGLRRFISLPIDELYNASLPLQCLDKKMYAELSIQLSSEHSFDKNVQTVEDYFLRRIHYQTKMYEFSRISHIVECIRATQGQIDINTLASEACLSRKQFERTFREYIGISPKQYLKTIRLQASIYTKSQNPYISLTEVAYKHGYYDQSHFINEYKTMTGLSPKQFFGDCEHAVSDFFE